MINDYYHLPLKTNWGGYCSCKSVGMGMLSRQRERLWDYIVMVMVFSSRVLQLNTGSLVYLKITDSCTLHLPGFQLISSYYSASHLSM